MAAGHCNCYGIGRGFTALPPTCNWEALPYLFCAARRWNNARPAATTLIPAPVQQRGTPVQASLLAQQEAPQTYVPEAVFIDAAGTLLKPSESAAAVYKRYADRWGCTLSERDILARYRRVYQEPWGRSPIRFEGDARPFWQHIVRKSTGVDSYAMFEEIYQYYESADAWVVAVDAVESLERLRDNGMKLAVVSNFDTRLRSILKRLGIDYLFDEIIVSAEVGAEKPNPRIFGAACAALNVTPDLVVHIGDDRRNDVWGARDAGIRALLYGQDVSSFEEVVDGIITGELF